jgi:hypothetical protein
MKVQVGDLVQILDKAGVPEVDPYLVIGGCKYGNIKCRNLVTGTEWTSHWKHVRPLTEENIEEAHRILEDRKKKMHEEMNNFLDKFK